MKRNILLLALLLAAFASTQAQNSNLIYSSQRMPQCNLANPAIFPARNNFFLILPGVNINFASPLAYSDIFQYTPGDSIATINANNIFESLSRDGRLSLNTELNTVGLGLKAGPLFLTGYLNAHMGFQLGIPTGLAKFLSQGNSAFRGEGNELYLLDGSLLDINAYAEAGVGLGVEVFQGLTVGARFKMYNGYFNASTVNTMLRLYTADDISSIRTDLYYQLRMAGCFPTDQIVQTDEEGNVSINIPSDLELSYMPNNRGYGIDLGARFEWRKFDFSASLQDLGASIRWDDNVQYATPTNDQSSFTFTGLEFNDCIDENGNFNLDFATLLLDSLNYMIQPTFAPGEGYRTYLPTKLNLSAMYKLTPWLRLGAMYHGEFAHHSTDLLDNEAFNFRNYRGRTSVVGQVSLMDWIEVVANMAVVDDGNKVSWFNPGIGLDVSLFKMIQVYALMDYISNIYLVDAKSFNISFGLNIMLINKRFDWYQGQHDKKRKS